VSFYNEGYYFVPWRRVPKADWEDDDEGDVFELDLPGGMYSEPLGRFGGEADTGPYDDICLVRWPEGTPEPPGLRPVAGDLERLLRAGRVYIPALAIANNLRYQRKSKNWTEAEAIEKFIHVLRDELESQRNRPFFLAKALQYEDLGYQWPVGYVWIVDYQPSKKAPIWWVTSHYELSQSAVTDFDVDVAYLAERFAVRPKLGV